ncbi:cysteine protease ATG4 [Mytilus galloprovincialis]|uniref:Cysteine protease n=1 Tax=Mytilus galloprovincialis TaxID=29158 RepID=A0A8B6GM77_MYTGA|nr:cysteine protease ATG4 [Mytilus galloprovincialis]
MDFLTEVSTFTYEAGPVNYDEFPPTEEPVYLMGTPYSTLYDLNELKLDFLSRIWLTYRKNFPAIGGTGPTLDTGWGCMLRCGQMMLAQALLNRHCGRDWRWTRKKYDEKYRKVLEMFLDKKNAYYSIHQIASMGVSEGKNIGQWFGPNTVAQVLKKLVVFDEWSSLVIHVAMDNTIIEHDIKCLCKPGYEKTTCDILGMNSMKAGATGCSSRAKPQDKNKSSHVDPSKWKPLLLILPLRLGLTDINAVYIESLKKCLSFTHSVGIIGGKPNQAHWFVGYVGDKLIYLDPHTTQVSVDLNDHLSNDDSFHCPHPCMMNILELDPSIAVGFYCGTESEFDDLCTTIRKFITCESRTPMFELYQDRPPHWPPYEPYSGKFPSSSEFAVLDGTGCETDDEFELIG